MNTDFYYTYVDQNGYKQEKTVILAGEITLEQIEPYLDEGLYFIPSQVGLEDLQKGFLIYGPLGENDHVWHKIEEGDITPTGKEPTIADFSAADLLCKFKQIVWDVAGASKFLGI